MKTPYPLQWLAGIASLILSGFSKKDSRLIVLTSFHGDGYRGNTKILFEALQDHPELNAVWLSRNHTLVKELRNTYGEQKAFLSHSPSGLKKLASASILLFTHGTSDFPFLTLPRKSVRIQTYHGLPTKRGEYLRPKSDRRPGFLHRLILKYRFSPISLFLSSSATVTEIFSKRFGLPESRFAETGYPCYDRLINGSPDPDLLKNRWPDLPAYHSVIIYSPTFRQFSKTKWFPFDDFSLEQLSDFLEKNKILLLLRPHPNDKINLSEYLKTSPRIRNAGQQNFEDIYKLLMLTDAIITDYSSIYIEGLLRDIPSLFVPYDIDSYERGLAFPYDETTPGDKAHSFEAFTESLQRMVDGDYGYRDEMDKVKSLFFSNPDGNATGRVIDLIEEITLSGK